MNLENQRCRSVGYKIARGLVVLLVRALIRIETSGLENLPPSGGYIVAANHLGRLDAALVFSLLDREDIILIIAEKYRRNRFWRWLVKQLDAIWIDRFNADFTSMRETLNRLRRGHVLVAAPEGTRSPTEALQEGRPGVSYLAVKAGVPIVPAAVTGTEDRVVKERLRRFSRANVKLRVGKPFFLPPVKGKSAEREAALQKYTDEIMCQIAAMLPEKYRGVYKDHPRLREILPGR